MLCTPLDLFIKSERRGIDPIQKSFFFEFIKRYEEILESVRIPLEEKIKKREFKEYVTLDMKSDFHIWSLVIYSLKNNDYQFSIGLSSDTHKISNIRLTIKDYKFKAFLT